MYNIIKWICIMVTTYHCSIVKMVFLPLQQSAWSNVLVFILLLQVAWKYLKSFCWNKSSRVSGMHTSGRAMFSKAAKNTSAYIQIKERFVEFSFRLVNRSKMFCRIMYKHKSVLFQYLFKYFEFLFRKK